MDRRSAIRVARLAGLLALLPLLAHAAQGDLLSVTTTTRMDMPGAPPQVAGMLNRTSTRNLCVPLARRTDPTIWNETGNCTASNVHQSADALSAHLVCRDMVADIEMRFLPGGVVHGAIHMNGSAHGMRMTGEQTIDGKRIGSCDTDAPHE